MRSKKNYLIWREKNDFFTALSSKCMLSTWSMSTGNLLYKRNAKIIYKIDVADWEVYRSNKYDDNYCKDYYCFENRTITLLKDKNYRKI